METLKLDYAPKGVRFYYVYKALAHPEHNDYVKAFTLEERLLHIAEAERTLGSSIPWLADNISNELKRALGGAQNAELVIDPEGRVARRRAWSDPEALREDLAALVGAPKKTTRVRDIDLKTEPPERPIPRGIVPRVELTDPMQALRIEPVMDDEQHPFYVKLRAEADEAYLDSGNGKLYVGFHLDPLYRVHWNNLAKPLEFELRAPDGLRISPLSGRAPKIEEPADADPREFLLDIRGDDPTSPLDLTVRYFACDNANTFCVPVTQNYRVHLEIDPLAGRSMARGRPGGSMGRLMQFDTDGDGRISRKEAPERMKSGFARIDTNGDGSLDADELQAMAGRMRGGGRDRE